MKNIKVKKKSLFRVFFIAKQFASVDTSMDRHVSDSWVDHLLNHYIH